MRRTLAPVLTVLVIVLFSCGRSGKGDVEKTVANDDRGYIVKVGDMAPDFIINEAGGESYR